jgi:hypothetical protein
MKYIRKTSEIIEAIQWKGDNKQEMFEFLEWFFWDKTKDIARGIKFKYNSDEGLDEGLYIGPINVDIGDYIIKDGTEFIVYCEDIFNEIYELASQNPAHIGINLQQHGEFPNYTYPNNTLTTGKILLNENDKDS